MNRLDPKLLPRIKELGEFDATACMNCGTCTAVCPMGLASLPREIFRYAVLGMEERLRETIPAVFACLRCRMCQANCPSQVKIAENVRTLRVFLNRRHNL
jgi:heterodisulfide reductase subunit C2